MTGSDIDSVQAITVLGLGAVEVWFNEAGTLWI